MRRLISFGIPKGNKFKIALVLAVFQGLSAIALLGSSAWLISRASEQPSLIHLSIAIVGVRTFALSRASLRYAERWLSHDAAFSSLTEKRPNLFAKLIPLAPAGFRGKSMGEVSTQAIADVDELQNLPLRVISPFLQSVVVSIASIGLFAFILPTAAPVLAGCLLLAFLLAIPLANMIASKYDRENSRLRSDLADASLNIVENSEILASYGWFESSLERLNRIQSEISKRAQMQSSVVGIGSAMFSFGAVVSSVISLWLGYKSLQQGQVEPVMLAVFALLPLGIFDVAAVAQSSLASWRKYRSSAERLLELETSNLPAEVDFAFGAKSLAIIKSLELKGIALGYPGGPPVVTDFSMQLKAGETVALIGPSGSGKSSVALALAFLLKLRNGQYLLNGKAASSYSEQSLRSRIGYLEQSPAIFDGTVRENLSISAASVTESQMISALERVNLWRMLEVRGGLDCRLGEKGVLISGGEAQRLAFARALIADFDLLVMDEPTANIDAVQSKKLIRDLLSSIKPAKIVLLITHDSDVARMASRTIRI